MSRTELSDDSLVRHKSIGEDDTVGLFIFLAAAMSNIFICMIGSIALGHETPILLSIGFMMCGLMFPVLREFLDTSFQRNVALTIWTVLLLTMSAVVIFSSPELKDFSRMLHGK